MKKIIAILLSVALPIGAMAQSGTRSHYSQYGLGTLADRSNGASKGMNGVGQGMRAGNTVNTLNPASYSSIDSLTMVFDMGASGQMTQFKEGVTRVNSTCASFDYAVGSFRLLPSVGMAFGILPYSNVGYKYAGSEPIQGSANSVSTAYTGSGGLHQVFVGAGVNIFKPLSVGVNVAYLWGDFSRTAAFSGSSSASIYSLQRIYSSTVSSYKFDIGAQWEQPVGKKDMLTAGVTVELGHNLGAEAKLQNVNSGLGTVETLTADDAYSIPMTYSIGLSWKHGNKLIVAADYSLMKWGDIDYPEFNDATGQYALKSGLLKDRSQINIGGEYTPSSMSRKFLNRVHYRVGAGFATPYYNINNVEGPKETTLSCGVGVPIMNGWNNRSVLNVGLTWGYVKAKDMINENTLRLNIGMTFNERWFQKWRVK